MSLGFHVCWSASSILSVLPFLPAILFIICWTCLIVRLWCSLATLSLRPFDINIHNLTLATQSWQHRADNTELMLLLFLPLRLLLCVCDSIFHAVACFGFMWCILAIWIVTSGSVVRDDHASWFSFSFVVVCLPVCLHLFLPSALNILSLFLLVLLRTCQINVFKHTSYLPETCCRANTQRSVVGKCLHNRAWNKFETNLE